MREIETLGMISIHVSTVTTQYFRRRFYQIYDIKSKNDGQHNGQKQQGQRANNDLQNITQKTKD